MPRLDRMLAQRHLVLCSPPGSGKTTRVPLSLLQLSWLAGKKILMLEPRRPAARMAARYMAGLLGEPLGRTVGYQVRMERRIGPDTRIEVLTEGLLTRRLQADPELSDVGVVIFDEYHERSLQADLGLALCLDVCASLRDDLRLLVMSATLDEQKVARLIGGQALNAEGGLHPVEIHYLQRSAGGNTLQATARLVTKALQEQSGDLLVFLPGKAEMGMLAKLIDGCPAEILMLHGELDAVAQERALLPEPGHPRRVVLATDVAETSLTIEGIGVVVDSGLARKPRFDPGTGLSRLQTVPISQASADQRAGRAGRLGPGACYRAWTVAEHRQRDAQRSAEILQADLAPLVLELALWGVTDPEELHWLDLPPAGAWGQARALLQALDALDEKGRITAGGRRMAGMGLHPRLAHLLVRAGREDCRLAADLAALLSERDFWRSLPEQPRPVDLRQRLDVLDRFRKRLPLPAGVEKNGVAQVARLSERLARQCRGSSGSGGRVSPAGLLSLAYPDWIAQRRRGSKGRFLTALGRGAIPPADDFLAAADYLAVCRLDAGRRDGRIWQAMALDETELRRLHGRRIVTRQRVYWDPARGRVAAVDEEYLDRLRLSSRPLADVEPGAVVQVMMEAVRTEGLGCLGWSEPAFQLQARIQWAARIWPDAGWPDCSESTLLARLADWLPPWLDGKRTRQALNGIDMGVVLQSLISWDQRQRLDNLLPERWRFSTQNSARIDYTQDPPVLAAPLQQFYGLAHTPAVAQGALPLLLHLLSPAGRPLQVTTDLAHFWSHAWEQVKKEMRGRYPKHHWPDDPATALPVKLKRHLS